VRAIHYEQFGVRPTIENVADPSPKPGGVVVRVEATGVCRSDWHGWCGHDPDITLPHVPGHELAGTIVAVGREVRNWRADDRVTVPFVSGCGSCPTCADGNQHVCPTQFQPGFTAWGSMAEFVALDHADTNLVRVPEAMSSITAASLGCRVATSFRAVVDQGRIQPGDWLVIHGCGGVGLAAVMIGAARGARVIAVDVSEPALALAARCGAQHLLDGGAVDVGGAVHELTGGGAHVSIDALGHAVTARNSLLSLRRRGRHVQVGLLAGEHLAARLPLDRMIAWELEFLGSHGMQAHRYPEMLALIADGRLDPSLLIESTVTLDDAIDHLVGFGSTTKPGIRVIDRF
jgi:alcohol dehydrogenase